MQEPKNILTYKRDCYQALNSKINGVVSDAYCNDDIDVKAFVIFFTNGQRFVNPVFLTSLNGKIKAGDSLSKKPGILNLKSLKRGYHQPNNIRRKC